jgi:hypothetical protein
MLTNTDQKRDLVRALGLSRTSLFFHFPKFSRFKISPVTSRVDGCARRGCGRDRDSVFRDNLQSHLRCSARSHGYSANQRCRLSRQSSPTFTSLTRTNNSPRSSRQVESPMGTRGTCIGNDSIKELRRSAKQKDGTTG